MKAVSLVLLTLALRAVAAPSMPGHADKQAEEQDMEQHGSDNHRVSESNTWTHSTGNHTWSRPTDHNTGSRPTESLTSDWHPTGAPEHGTATSSPSVLPPMQPVTRSSRRGSDVLSRRQAASSTGHSASSTKTSTTTKKTSSTTKSSSTTKASSTSSTLHTTTHASTTSTKSTARTSTTTHSSTGRSTVDAVTQTTSAARTSSKSSSTTTTTAKTTSTAKTTTTSSRTTTTTKTTTTTTTTTAGAGATQTIDVTGMTYENAMLIAHNVHRSNHSLSALNWNQDLANIAQSWASQCQYGHNVTAGGGGYGQNIGAGAPGNAAAGLVTNLMYNGEINYYPLPYGDDNPSLDNFHLWGHYSQIVWTDTTDVGCVTQYCPNGLANTGPGVAPYFTVCNYSPPGNYVGEFSEVAAPNGGATVVIIGQ